MKLSFVELGFDSREYTKCKTGFKTYIFEDVSSEKFNNLHKDWGLRRSNVIENWPTELFRPVGYWITIWKQIPSEKHITFKPGVDGWSVYYSKKNTWMGGQEIGDSYSFEEALSVAHKVMIEESQIGEHTDSTLRRKVQQKIA